MAPSASRVTNTRRDAANRSSASQARINSSARTAASCTEPTTSALPAPASAPTSTVPGTSPAPARPARSANTTNPSPGRPVSPASPSNRPTGPSPVVSPMGRADTHCAWKRESRPVASSCPAASGRTVRDSTEATGAPAVSASSRAMVPSASRLSRTRSAEAPEAYRRTPPQENGIPPRPSSPTTKACNAASKSAGCRPKASPSVPSARATSANSSSPLRQAARSPWKDGP